jgi:hypothetical protein
MMRLYCLLPYVVDAVVSLFIVLSCSKLYFKRTSHMSWEERLVLTSFSFVVHWHCFLRVSAVFRPNLFRCFLCHIYSGSLLAFNFSPFPPYFPFVIPYLSLVSLRRLSPFCLARRGYGFFPSFRSDAP